jgi:hypothetical protein
MICHVGLHAATTTISSYMTIQIYLNLYKWQSVRMGYVHDDGPARFSRAVRDIVSSTYHYRWIGRGRPTAWPLRSPDFNPLDFFLWGHLKSLAYAAPVDNEETLHHRVVDACQTIRSCPGIFEWMQKFMMRRTGE